MQKKFLMNLILLWVAMLFVCFHTFAQMPYNIVMNMPQEPTTQMAFNWFTTSNTTNEQVQVSLGTGTFIPFMTVTVSTTTPQNVHKAVVTGLTPNTKYSFRVGKANLWSSIGTFTTAKNNKEPFSFIYTTDSQASTVGQFDTAQITTHAAFSEFQNVNFWLQCGDIVNTGGDLSQWNKFFSTQQDLFYKYPFAPVLGNHDGGTIFTNHFNLGTSTIDTTYRSTYTFIYGDAQFFAINSEANLNTYKTALSTWMRNEANAHPEIKWRIVYFHKNVYTGGMWMGDGDVKNWREAMAPLFDELNIDIAFQGHDHIYEVIGPVYNKNLVQDAVSNVSTATPTGKKKVNGSHST